MSSRSKGNLLGAAACIKKFSTKKQLICYFEGFYSYF